MKHNKEVKDADKADQLWQAEELARELGLILSLGDGVINISDSDEKDGMLAAMFDTLEGAMGYLYGIQTVRKYEPGVPAAVARYTNEFLGAAQNLEYATARLDTYLAAALPKLKTQDAVLDIINQLPRGYPGMRKVYAYLETVSGKTETPT